MSDKLKFIAEAEKSVDNFKLFSKFVNESEFLWRDNGLLPREEGKRDYREIWLNLETLNALALDEWEQAGFPESWDGHWVLSYKKDAKNLIYELINLILGQN